MNTEQTFCLVLRSSWEREAPDPWVETIQAGGCEDALERALGITDDLLVGAYPASEEDRLREALRPQLVQRGRDFRAVAIHHRQTRD